MKLSEPGTNTINVENITPFGIWVSDGKVEYAIPFSDFPCLKKASVEDLMNPVLYHGFHLCWEALDVDVDLSSLDHMDDFPIYFDSEPSSLMAVAEKSDDY